MFIILIITGLIFIGIGIKLKIENPNIKNENNYKKIEDIEILKKRVGELERYFSLAEDLKKEDTLELIRKYENEGYSIEEISRLLEKSEGEILLLKKLEKNY